MAKKYATGFPAASTLIGSERVQVVQGGSDRDATTSQFVDDLVPGYLLLNKIGTRVTLQLANYCYLNVDLSTTTSGVNTLNTLVNKGQMFGYYEITDAGTPDGDGKYYVQLEAMNASDSLPEGGTLFLKNNTDKPLYVRAQDGTSDLSIVVAGGSIALTLSSDNVTANGNFLVQRFDISNFKMLNYDSNSVYNTGTQILNPICHGDYFWLIGDSMGTNEWTLPDFSSLGGPKSGTIFYIQNVGSTPLTLKNYGGATLTVIQSAAIMTIIVKASVGNELTYSIFFQGGTLLLNVSSYTLTSDDNGLNLVFDNGTDITLTIPAGLIDSFSCNVYQKNTGRIVFDDDSGATTLIIANGNTKTATAGAGAFIQYAGAANTYMIDGNLTA